jgi:hypothetical protein
LREAKRRLDEKRAAEARPVPKSRPERLEEAKRRLEEEHQVHCRANEAYEAYRARGVMKDGRRFGKPPTPYQPPARPQGKVNVTDPDSRNVKTPRGYAQGYNAQAVCNERQIVVAAEINADSPDFGHLEPMVTTAERELRAAGVDETPEVVVADAGYWHHDQIDAIASRGIGVLIAPDAGKRKGTRPGWDGGRYAAQRARDRARARALPQTAGDDRAGVRPHEVQPADRPLLTPRQSRLPVGMAPDHRHPQPAEAPQPPDRGGGRLRAPLSPRATHPRNSPVEAAPYREHARLARICATATTSNRSAAWADPVHPVPRHDLYACELAIGGSLSTVAVAMRHKR